MKTVEYLDAVKRRLNLESDYALSLRLDLTRQAISNLRSGGVMSPTTAAKVAALLEIDALRVIADAELERGSDAQLWGKLRDALAAVLVAIGALHAAPAEARFNISSCTVAQGTSVQATNFLCIALHWARRLLERLAPRWAAA